MNFRRTSNVLLFALVGSAALAQAPSPSPSILAPPPASESPSFSAEIVDLNGGGARPGTIAKLHAADHKVRIETDAASAGFFLSDATAGTALFVRPAQRIYLDARQSTPLTRVFVWVEPSDPCRQWQAAAAIAGAEIGGEWRCSAIDRQVVSRHEIIEFRVLMPDRRSSYGWIDSTIGFVVKWQAADGKMFALDNILPQELPASLFNVPPDYRKLDPRTLIERIKHSDVWADIPK